MAAIAAPLLEGATVALLRALGVSVVAGGAAVVANEEAKRRAEAAEKAGASPIAQAGTQEKEKRKCKQCPPDKGVLTQRSTSGWPSRSVEYQHRIAQMPPAPVGYLSEWMFNEVEFDGFNSGECLLKEAKANYDQFFNNSFEPYFWWEKNAEKMVDQAYRQGISAQPRPPTRLRWHFMTPIAFRYFSRLIISAAPAIEIEYQP